jgi:hypothetical protein
MDPDEHRPRDRRVVGHQLEQHQSRADRSLGQNQDRGQDRSKAGGMTGRTGPENPDHQHSNRNQGQPARETVRKLNQRGQLRRTRDHLAVAERPVIPAPRP